MRLYLIQVAYQKAKLCSAKEMKRINVIDLFLQLCSFAVISATCKLSTIPAIDKKYELLISIREY